AHDTWREPFESNRSAVRVINSARACRLCSFVEGGRRASWCPRPEPRQCCQGCIGSVAWSGEGHQLAPPCANGLNVQDIATRRAPIALAPVLPGPDHMK